MYNSKCFPITCCFVASRAVSRSMHVPYFASRDVFPFYCNVPSVQAGYHTHVHIRYSRYQITMFSNYAFLRVSDSDL